MKYIPLAIFFAMLACTPCFGSISGTYKAKFEMGNEGSMHYSYIHKSTGTEKIGDAGYKQYASGTVWFAIDFNDEFSFTYNDLSDAGEGVVSAGDTVTLDIEVGLYAFDGFGQSNYNGDSLVATMKLAGTFTVGGSHSSGGQENFEEGVYNIDTEGDTDGLDYEITKTSGAGAFDLDDVLYGDAFFQAANYGGPFNGIKEKDGLITFAVWGDSRNTDNHGGPSAGANSTGRLDTDGNRNNDVVKSAGFDFFVKGEFDDGGDNQIPEPATILIWSGLGLAGIGARRLKKKRSAA